MDVKHARRLALHGHGLLQKEPFGRGIKAVQRAIEQIHYVQIDTISVVSRAHHHVLKTRVPNYSPGMLHKLQAEEQSIFEYWSHAAAYLPMKDYRYYLAMKRGYATKRKVDAKVRREVLNRIDTEGPQRSKDFEAEKGRKSNGWWDWKPAKLALEILFLSGELMIKERQNFQKVYDRTDNVLPDHVDVSLPSPIETGKFYVRGMLGNLGIAQARDIAYARPTVTRFNAGNIQPLIDDALLELTESGEVEKFEFLNKTHYCLSESLDDCPKRINNKRITFLSPFDNLIINRRRLSELFKFDYLLECYVPENKRKFGYFTLPILFGSDVIGRLDAKANRKTKTLQINNLWLESKTKLDDELIEALATSLISFQQDLDCIAIKITNMAVPKMKKIVQQKLNSKSQLIETI